MSGDTISVHEFGVHESRHPIITLANRHGAVSLLFINKHLAEVRNLYVHESHQRQGIGTLLIKEVERHARNLGIAKLTLTCRADNTAGCAFYDKNGYKREGVLENHYGPNRNLVVFSKFLKTVLEEVKNE